MDINYYSLLHLKRHCTKDDIHRAFGKLVNSQIPNCCLVMLCEAYEVLSDPFRRAIYDEYGEEGIKKGVNTNELYIDPWTYHCDVKSTYLEYCTLNNPITNLFIKSNGSVVINLKKDKGGPDIVKLRLQLTLNEIFNGSIKLVELKRKPSTLCDSISNKRQVLKINIPRGFPTGGTLKSEVSKPDIGYNNVKTVYIFTTEDLPHKVFKRDNMNLIMVQKVMLKQVLLGIRIVIKTLDHKVLRVNITEVITNVLQTTDAEFLDEVPDTMLTLREIAKRHSQFGGQGYQKCFCKTSCKTNRCACRKNNVLCSSRCHEKTTCNNKQDYVKVIHNEGMPDMNDPSQRGDIIILFDIIYPLYLPIDDTFCELLNDKKINT